MYHRTIYESYVSTLKKAAPPTAETAAPKHFACFLNIVLDHCARQLLTSQQLGLWAMFAEMDYGDSPTRSINNAHLRVAVFPVSDSTATPWLYVDALASPKFAVRGLAWQDALTMFEATITAVRAISTSPKDLALISPRTRPRDLLKRYAAIRPRSQHISQALSDSAIFGAVYQSVMHDFGGLWFASNFDHYGTLVEEAARRLTAPQPARGARPMPHTLLRVKNYAAANSRFMQCAACG